MQNADVEPAGDRLGVIDRVVFGDLATGKSAPVQRDAQLFEPVRLRPPGRKLDDAVGPGQRSGHDAVGVVIAAQEVGRHAAIGEARQLPVEKEPDRGVPPVAVEDIPGDHGEGDLLLERARDEILEGVPARPGEAGGDVAVLLREPDERAAQMQVGGVKESEAHRAMLTESAPASEAAGQVVHSARAEPVKLVARRRLGA